MRPLRPEIGAAADVDQVNAGAVERGHDLERVLGGKAAVKLVAGIELHRKGCRGADGRANGLDDVEQQPHPVCDPASIGIITTVEER